MTAQPLPRNALERINYLAERYAARHYLEIGPGTGKRFLAVRMPLKVGTHMPAKLVPACPEPGTTYLPVSSDAFFAAFTNRREDAANPLPGELDPPLFDIILIDGLHTFAQSLQDFENSLRCAHADTLFILQGSVPCDQYSAMPDRRESLSRRQEAGLPGRFWHGDVFKTVLAVHDRYPSYSYCTICTGRPHTIIWQAGESGRTPRFASLDEIDALDYTGMLRHADLMMPVKNFLLPDIIGLTLNPSAYGGADTWKKLIPEECADMRKFWAERLAQDRGRGVCEPMSAL